MRASFPTLLAPLFSCLSLVASAHAQDVPPRGHYAHHFLVQPQYNSFENETRVIAPDIWGATVAGLVPCTISLTASLQYPGQVPPGDFYRDKFELDFTETCTFPKGEYSGDALPPHSPFTLELYSDHAGQVTLPVSHYLTSPTTLPDSSDQLKVFLVYPVSIQDWSSIIHATRISGTFGGASFTIDDPAVFQALLDVASRARAQ